jgi:hypothetical protein
MLRPVRPDTAGPGAAASAKRGRDGLCWQRWAGPASVGGAGGARGDRAAAGLRQRRGHGRGDPRRSIQEAGRSIDLNRSPARCTRIIRNPNELLTRTGRRRSSLTATKVTSENASYVRGSPDVAAASEAATRRARAAAARSARGRVPTSASGSGPERERERTRGWASASAREPRPEREPVPASGLARAGRPGSARPGSARPTAAALRARGASSPRPRGRRRTRPDRTGPLAPGRGAGCRRLTRASPGSRRLPRSPRGRPPPTPRGCARA